MPLFHVTTDSLVPLRPLASNTSDLTGTLSEILWRDLRAVTGERLLPIYKGSGGDLASDQNARSSRLSSVGPSAASIMVTLDPQGNVVLVCVRRVFDHEALSDCLEALGWARNTTVSELAELHWQGMGEFWRTWQTFAGSAAPPSVSRKPRLVIAAADVAESSKSAVDFLLDHQLPVTFLRIALFANTDGSHILDVQGGPTPDLAISKPSALSTPEPEQAGSPTPMPPSNVESEISLPASPPPPSPPSHSSSAGQSAHVSNSAGLDSDTLTGLKQPEPSRLTGTPAVARPRPMPAPLPQRVNRAPEPAGSSQPIGPSDLTDSEPWEAEAPEVHVGVNGAR